MPEPVSLVTVIAHNDFIAEPPGEESPFWIDQIIPEVGVTFLFGATSVGKSPLSWYMATSIANGTPFFTYKTQPGRVLYLDLDTPKNLVHTRAHNLPPADNLCWAFSNPLQLRGAAWAELAQLAAKFQPQVVFVNTLRKAYNLPDHTSEVASTVYSAYQHLFPGAAIVFIHHERKAALNAESTAPKSENFAGSQAFQNDAQIAHHLHRSERNDQPEAGDGSYISLECTKSQVSAKGDLLDLFLGPDGVSLSIVGRTAVRDYLQRHPGCSNQEVMTALSVSKSTVMRAKRRK